MRLLLVNMMRMITNVKFWIFMSCSFIGYGVFRHEVASVLGKATRICLECIGVG
jgi:hypothetical protein